MSYLTMTTAAIARAAFAAADKEELLDEIRRWENCNAAEVDAAGDVWVEGSQRGRWLGESELITLYAFCERG